MKRLLLVHVLVLTAVCSIGQTEASQEIERSNSKNDLYPAIYQLFPTQNAWTFLKLNTRNSTVRQVHFDVEGDNRYETFLNLIPLVDEEKEINNRFTLYPTQNLWTFILFDQIDGKSWQVQWNQKPENRGIWPIE